MKVNIQKLAKAIASMSDEEKTQLEDMVSNAGKAENTPDGIDETTDPTTTTPQDESKNSPTSVDATTGQATANDNVDDPVEQTEPARVSNITSPSNGMSIDDIATKEMLEGSLGAMQSKIDELTKKYDNMAKINSDLRDKYEKNDFGYTGTVKPQTGAKDTSSHGYESLDDYCKQFE